MVEIFALERFTNFIGDLVQSKGYRPGHYRLAALLLWCAGEICGLFTGLMIAPKGDFPSLVVIYLCALLGTAAGAGLAYLIVRSLKVESEQSRSRSSFVVDGFVTHNE